MNNNTRLGLKTGNNKQINFLYLVVGRRDSKRVCLPLFSTTTDLNATTTTAAASDESRDSLNRCPLLHNTQLLLVKKPFLTNKRKRSKI